VVTQAAKWQNANFRHGHLVAAGLVLSFLTDLDLLYKAVCYPDRRTSRRQGRVVLRPS